MTEPSTNPQAHRRETVPANRRFLYYPGCTLYTKARNLDICGRLAAERVGFELVEMPSWNCCGAIYNSNSDDLAAQVGPVRNLAKASQLGDALVTLCAACHNVLKRAQNRLTTPGNEVERDRLIAFVEEAYQHPVKVLHYLEVLKSIIGLADVAAHVTKPLNGLKVASYYGCLMVRPEEVLQFDNPENPQVMDELIQTLGATPVRFDFKTECCGGYLVVNRREVATDCSWRIIDNARAWGAETIATTCPLCQYNLEQAQIGQKGSSRKKTGGSSPLPIFYFTQLLGLATGLSNDELAFDHNAIDPAPLLSEKGLL